MPGGRLALPLGSAGIVELGRGAVIFRAVTVDACVARMELVASFAVVIAWMGA